MCELIRAHGVLAIILNISHIRCTCIRINSILANAQRNHNPHTYYIELLGGVQWRPGADLSPYLLTLKYQRYRIQLVLQMKATGGRR